jgi:hypothetical protein
VTTHFSKSTFHALTFVFAAIAVVAFSSIPRADATHERAGCEAQAKRSFDDLTHEYVSVLENVKVRFEIMANDYQAAFSEKLESCLLLIHKRTSINREISDTAYLIDASSRTMYALYVETNGNLATCLLIPSIRETKPCKSRTEFDDFVGLYLK